MLLVNGNLRRYVGNFGSSFGLFEGSHADITAEWYQDVGVSILITMLLNTVNPHIVPVIMIGVKVSVLHLIHCSIFRYRFNN